MDTLSWLNIDQLLATLGLIVPGLLYWLVANAKARSRMAGPEPDIKTRGLLNEVS